MLWSIFCGSLILQGQGLLVWTGLVSSWLFSTSVSYNSGLDSHGVCAWCALELGGIEEARLQVAMHFRVGNAEDPANRLGCGVNPESYHSLIPLLLPTCDSCLFPYVCFSFLSVFFSPYVCFSCYLTPFVSFSGFDFPFKWRYYLKKIYSMN